MLWSPSEVLAYLNEDSSSITVGAGRNQSYRLTPTAPFGGFDTWPSHKDDFILIAENSEIHGPNPLFTIPELDSTVDLNSLSTLILSADYQGLSNNKILPGRNAELIMTDLVLDLHAVINYFFLFDSEARGFVRPTCVAYFTADKHKLIMLSEQILKNLNVVSSILQHTNILHHVTDLRFLRDSLKTASANTETSVSKEIVTEARLKDIQDVIDIAENYEGNPLYDKQIAEIVGNFKKYSVYDKLRDLDSVCLSPIIKDPPSTNVAFRPNTRKSMKNLYLICYNGLVLGLYHLYIMYKHFRRKYENIIIFENCCSKGDSLCFGACVRTSIRNLPNCAFQWNKCIFAIYRTSNSISLDSDAYFQCLDSTFERLLLSFIDCEKSELIQNNLHPVTSDELTQPPEINYGPSSRSDYLNSEPMLKEEIPDRYKCRHMVTLSMIWDLLEDIKIDNPGIEESFLRVLRMFDNTQRLLYAILTRTPLVVISTPQELHTAQDFIKALSVFIPRSKNEMLYVDCNRQEPLNTSDFSQIAAVNICLHKQALEDILPIQLRPPLCILNLKDRSFEAETYTGCLLTNVDERINALPTMGSAFSVFVSILSDIQRKLEWWHIITSSSADTSTALKYVLSKGLKLQDIRIIETLSKLFKS